MGLCSLCKSDVHAVDWRNSGVSSGTDASQWTLRPRLSAQLRARVCGSVGSHLYVCGGRRVHGVGANNAHVYLTMRHLLASERVWR
jgi:formate dehydrogenase maturation protein FdhE